MQLLASSLQWKRTLVGLWTQVFLMSWASTNCFTCPKNHRTLKSHPWRSQLSAAFRTRCADSSDSSLEQLCNARLLTVVLRDMRQAVFSRLASLAILCRQYHHPYQQNLQTDGSIKPSPCAGSTKLNAQTLGKPQTLSTPAPKTLNPKPEALSS